MNTHIWYFENSKFGVVVANLDSFCKMVDGHWEFKFASLRTLYLYDSEDIENFEKNILGLDG